MNITETKSIGATADAYSDNILIEACGPILSPQDIAKRLTYLPPRPHDVASTPPHIRAHQIGSVLRMHIPTANGISLAQSIDFMLRQGYVHRHPGDPATWRRIYGRGESNGALSAVQLACAVMGISGAGKSQAIERALSLYPQVIVHEKFPGLVGAVHQLLWLKVDVPGSGKIVDLVESLIRATDSALGSHYAEDLLVGRPRRGATLANEWLQKIACSFPGILVLDEIQNLFKIETLAVRQSHAKKVLPRPPLRIVDDEALKFVLTLTNSTKYPILVCGTADGMEAFNTRMSTSQRLMTAGFHHMTYAVTAEDAYFKKMLFPRLCEYQWCEEKLPASDEFRMLLHRLSGGVPRAYMTFWNLAHRHALSRKGKSLEFADFQHVSANALAPLRPAIEALLSGDPRKLILYEDLLPGTWLF